jgi:protein-S-isoprenylcysteine O-methyltransferase Ste14
MVSKACDNRSPFLQLDPGEAMNPTGFWWILLATAVYGGLHSLLASLQSKALAEKWFGIGVRRFYRLFFNIIGAVTYIPVLALAALTPDRHIYTIPAPWSLLLLLVQALAAGGVLVGVYQTGAMHFLGLAQLVSNPGEAGLPHLVDKGVYHIVRHPLYSFGLLALWLAPVLTWNSLAIDIGITVYILAAIPIEERKLQKEFGAAYAEYQRKTPMLVPGFRRKSMNSGK